jgi:hypothetical protein
MAASKWGARYRPADGGAWKRVIQFRNVGTAKKPAWKAWRREFPSEAVAEFVLDRILAKTDKNGKRLYVGHVFEIKQAPEPVKEEPLYYTPKQWGSIGAAPGYDGVPVHLAGGYMIPHYGAIGNVKGPVTRASEQALVKAFEKHHRFGNGWPGGLGYHVAVAQSGRAYMSVRGMNHWRGAHTGNAKHKAGDPNSHLGIVLLVGDNEMPSKAAIAKVERLRKHFGASTKVRYHKEFDWTSCPGVVIPRVIKTR